MVWLWNMILDVSRYLCSIWKKIISLAFFLHVWTVHQFHWSENEIPLQDIRHHVWICDVYCPMIALGWSAWSSTSLSFYPLLVFVHPVMGNSNRKETEQIFVLRVLIALLNRYQLNIFKNKNRKKCFNLNVWLLSIGMNHNWTKNLWKIKKLPLS